MAAVKMRFTSRTTCTSIEKENMGKSPNCTVVPCRHLTVAPCVGNTVHRLTNNGKKAPHASPASVINRYRSGVLELDSNNCPPWLLYRKEQRMTRITYSASNSSVLTAPRGLVTYLQLCRPIVPQVRTAYSGHRTYKPYLYEPKMGDTLTCPKGDPALVVYGVPFGQSVRCEKNLQHGSEKVHIHVYLPCEEQSGRESLRSQSEEEEACVKLTNLSIQDGKNSEIP